jgi:CheY-like chemotaxis protein
MSGESPSAATVSRNPGTPTVLIVDDEAVVLRVYGKVLRTAGFTVLAAADGDEALEILKVEPVSVMVTDLVMPEREGLETIVAARRRWPDLKILAMSGAFDGSLLGTAIALGAQGSLLKPVTAEALVDAVRAVLAPGSSCAEA